MEEYYNNCMFAKPKTRKKKLLYNGYKDKPLRTCYYTRKPNAERHEIWGGSCRQICIQHGFQVDVCREIHEELQHNTTEWAKKENERWHIYYQVKYEQGLIANGMTAEEAHRKWMELIGRNYI